MPVKYKIDVLAALKTAGYSTYKLRREKLLGESVIQQLRDEALVSWPNMGRLCHLLNCQPGDILEYEDDSAESASNPE
ncbi:helix-turn-helix domain-containing protein [Intestinimonas sp. HCP28S3_D6]|uniref:helix-turn-helix domain-containing protein n=1 Tax=Intestinimonas sp. HCP28S3_D6 TaxID=3438942 RepID=UPI003F8BDB45